MIIGSRDSMSYLEPHVSSKWFSFIERYIAKLKSAQVVDIKTQYEVYGVRAFDIHISFLKNTDKAYFKYDTVDYETFSIYDILNYLNTKLNANVRIVLEDLGEEIGAVERARLESRFAEYCQMIELLYPNICFYGGYREFDLKQLYKFKKMPPNNIVFYRRVDKLFK